MTALTPALLPSAKILTSALTSIMLSSFKPFKRSAQLSCASFKSPTPGDRRNEGGGWTIFCLNSLNHSPKSDAHPARNF